MPIFQQITNQIFDIEPKFNIISKQLLQQHYKLIQKRMQRNSNQQSYSVSIRGKREHLRAQVRKQQLHQYFRTKRIELFTSHKSQDRLAYYKNLQQRIEKFSYDRDQASEIEKEVRDLFEKHLDQSWNYTMVGNLLLKFPSRMFDYKGLIFMEESIPFHSDDCFVWCLGIYVHLVCNQIDEAKYKGDFRSEIESMDAFLGILLERHFQGFSISQNSIRALDIYLLCFKFIMASACKESLFPINCFNVLTEHLQKIYNTISQQTKVILRDVKLRITQLINELISIIQSKELFSYEVLQYESGDMKMFVINEIKMQRLFRCAAEVFLDNIKESSDERSNCLQSVLKLTAISPITAGEYLFTRNLVIEFQYLIINHTLQTRTCLLQSFAQAIPTMTNTKVISLLQSSLHMNLVTILQNSLLQLNLYRSPLERIHSEFLFQTLRVIEILLDKLHKIDSSMVKGVLQRMDIAGLGDLIEKMNKFRFSQEIESIQCNLIDNYFSEEVEQEHNQEMEQNYHYSNNNSNSYNNNNNNNINNDEDFQI